MEHNHREENPKYLVFHQKGEGRRKQIGFPDTAASDRVDNSPPRRLKYRCLQSRIGRLQGTYRAGNRNIEDYWNAMINIVETFL